ncbi:hypothetical protein HKD37_06G016755 [Glycine soja]|nr:hypothetical protein JHK87_016009 [Glycine soja]
MVEITPVTIVMEPRPKANDAPTESTSYEATCKDSTAVIIHTTSSGPNPINFAPSNVLTKIEVKEMIGLAMDNFVEKQKVGNEEFRRTMQQAIATQFSSLSESLILNLEQAQMRLFSVVVVPMSLPPTQALPPASVPPTLPTLNSN